MKAHKKNFKMLIQFFGGGAYCTWLYMNLLLLSTLPQANCSTCTFLYCSVSYSNLGAMFNTLLYHNYDGSSFKEYSLERATIHKFLLTCSLNSSKWVISGQIFSAEGGIYNYSSMFLSIVIISFFHHSRLTTSFSPHRATENGPNFFFAKKRQ